MIDKNDLQSKLNNKEIEIYTFNTIDSTNDFLKTISSDSKICLAISSEQSKGKGSKGRSFFSPKSGIYFSIKYTKVMLQHPELLTICAALSVQEAIYDMTNLDVSIKWVNDILISRKKVCGILCEAITNYNTGEITDYICGIGINLETPNEGFPCEFRDRVCSICDFGCDIDTAQLVARVINNLNNTINKSIEDIIYSYKEKLCHINEVITVIKNGVSSIAKAIDLNNIGNLIVEYTDGTIEELNSGEISIRI